MKVIVSHPTSNQNNRAVLSGLLESNMLYEFYTSIAVFEGGFLKKATKIRALNDILRRNFESELKDYTKTSPAFELGRAISSKLGLKSLTKHESGMFSIDSIYQHMDKKVASSLGKGYKNGVDAIYAYEDGAYQSFKEAKKYGMKCIYDLPIAYWETSQRLMREEFERLPAWGDTIQSGLSDSEEKLKRKENELKMADIISVPSFFVKNSLPTWAQDKQIIMTPFGTPQIIESDKNLKQTVLDSANQKEVRKPLRILFVGSMSQRKGLGDLFQAVNMLNSREVELVVLGSLMAPIEFYNDKIKKGFTYEKVRPHNEVLELMKTCDVFCLPSIVEGRALVMQEAMSQGLPIIITPNTGGEDLVKEGETGFMVPIRSPAAIAEKILWFLDNRLNIPKMGKSAKSHAASYTWKAYSDRIIKGLSDSNNI